MTAEDLKKSILQQAIQGKLVPQNPDDEPASALLDRIRAEKARLVAEGRIKRDKNESVIYRNPDGQYIERIGKTEKDISDEIPFEIPESWEWVRLGSIVDFSKSNSVKPHQIESDAWLLDLEDIEKDSGRVLQKKIWKNVISKSDKHKFHKGNVLYSKLRPYLNKVVIADEDGYCTSEILCFDFGFINSRYAQIYLMSPFFIDYAMSEAYGVKMPRLGSQHGNNAFMPLPPLAEQERIVAKIEELMPMVEEYGKAQSRLDELNSSLGDNLRKSVLQYAIQGKLVPQNPDDEPASALLDRIRTEKARLVAEGKIKRDKNESVIYRNADGQYIERIGKTEKDISDEIPFEIPDNWEWVRLKEIVSILGDGIHGTPKYDEKGDFFFINGNNLKNKTIIIKSDTKRVDYTEYIKYKKDLNQNTILVSINGTIGNLGFYNNEPVILGKSACYFNLIFHNLKEYIYQLLCTDYFIQYAIEKATGTTIKNVSLFAMNNLLVPLPPLKEQERIVERIEQIFSLYK